MGSLSLSLTLSLSLFHSHLSLHSLSPRTRALIWAHRWIQGWQNVYECVSVKCDRLYAKMSQKVFSFLLSDN